MAIETSWEIYNEDTVKRLQAEDPYILPTYSVDEDKDLAYNKKQITSAITSAIIQGKSIDGIADDLQSRISSLNRSSAVKTARTAITSAQNGGKLSSLYELKAMGIEVQKEWVATLDDRTRASHRALDGQRRDLDEAFSNGLQYPGDSSGSAAEVWRCRCTMTSYIPDVDTSDAVRWSRDPATGKREYVPGITYEQWARSKTTLNLAKAIDSIQLARGTSNYKYEPESIVAEMQRSKVGTDAVTVIEMTDVVITIADGEWYSGIRGEQIGNQIILYQNNINSLRVAAQTLIHELTHYGYGIGNCQHAEAICFAFEKMHLMGRDYLTQDEWEYVKQLAIDNYPEYEWEKGGYGDYERFDFIK